MTDNELIAALQQRSTKALLSGAILDHCWLGVSAETMEEHAGSWEVRLNIEELEQLLDIVHRNRWWYENDSLGY